MFSNVWDSKITGRHKKINYFYINQSLMPVRLKNGYKLKSHTKESKKCQKMSRIIWMAPKEKSVTSLIDNRRSVGASLEIWQSTKTIFREKIKFISRFMINVKSNFTIVHLRCKDLMRHLLSLVVWGKFWDYLIWHMTERVPCRARDLMNAPCRIRALGWLIIVRWGKVRLG